MKTRYAIFIVLYMIFSFHVQVSAQTINTDWESGIGDWSADNGLWDAGIPIVGPSSTHSGNNCVGTELNSNYHAGGNSRLISPSYALPSVSGDEKILLKFWQWFRLSNDYGLVQISVDGEAWQTLNDPRFDGYALSWTQYVADLTNYAGLTVRIGFLFTSGTYNNDNGWYIDDISIEKKVVTFNNPEDWESGIGDWSADNGLWDAGIPIVGPSSTHSGNNCVGTELNSNYHAGGNSRLISPSYALPSVSGDEKILLKFWQWFRLSNDYGLVQISVDGGAWQTLNDPRFDGYALSWTQYVADLTNYAGLTVRIGFLFTSGTYNTDNGWYVDDIELVTNKKPTLTMPDTLTLLNNSSTVLNMWDYADDEETADTLLTYTFSVSNDSLLWDFDNKTGELTLTAPGFEGTAKLYASITDEAGASAYDTLVAVVTIPVGIENPNDISLQYILQQNYPNPFNKSTSIAYSIAKAGNVKIEIYDITGTRLAILLDEYKPAGRHKLILDGTNLSGGFYFYKIQAGNFMQMRKMLLVK